jgi:hypothetical protein
VSTKSHQIRSEVNQTSGSPALLIPGVIPTVLGVVLCVAGFSVAGTVAEPGCSAVIPSPIALIAGRHQIVTGFVSNAVAVPVDSCFQEPPLPVVPADHPNTHQVRPPVRDFLKRVVVPILVERYIARLNRDRLLARTEEAL